MSIERRLSRRRVLGAAGLAAGSIALPRLVFAQNKKAVTFTLPWVAEGSNLFTFVAKRYGVLGEARARCRYRPRLGIGRRGASDRRSPLRIRHGLPVRLD